MAARCGGERERGHVRALLADSERRRLQDAAGWERGLVAGWAAAVQGWGKAAPFACLQLQKKVKKSRASEAVNNNCLICLDMMQTAEKSLVLETKPAKEQSKPNSKFSTCTTEETVSEKEEVPVHSSEAICGPITDGIKREICNGKFHSPQAFQGEKKSLPIKEFSIWHLETLKHKDRKSNEPSVPDTDNAESLLKPSLVLPPVKDATPKNNPDASLKKNKAVFSQTKMLYGTSEETSSEGHESQTEQRREKEIDVVSTTVKEKMKMNESSFVPSLPKASFLQGDPELLHWHCALLPDKKTATTSNSVTLKKNCNLASMQYTKQETVRSPFTSNIRSRNPEAKQGSESKIQELSLLSGLLPSLTVSHVTLTALSSKLT
ncbi:uncharacterized protein C16orf46 homolog [Alligator mississippiensis]|uniref:uncharacterized protein C16orf46 homolog n=1 Tax=Alligator mississippiensis TaxID=8496 RepID=UPI002877935B|nr:uncharacterized protein C16orf46 homolog [Alligator mississippiensis]